MNINDVVKRQIDALEDADVAALKAKFMELFGFACGATNARNLRNRLAYKVQELYFGGFSAEDKAMLESIADKDPASNLKISGRKAVTFVKGTRLCRDWKGKPMRFLSVRTADLNSMAKSTAPSRRLPKKSPGPTGTGKNSSG